MVRGTRRRIDLTHVRSLGGHATRTRVAFHAATLHTSRATSYVHTNERARANEKEHTHVRDAARLYIRTYVNTHLRMRQETSCANRSGSL